MPVGSPQTPNEVTNVSSQNGKANMKKQKEKEARARDR